MGYTHYWGLGPTNCPNWKEIFPKLSADARKLIETSDVIVDAGDEEGSPPILTEEEIVFSGGYDTFVLTRDGDPVMGFCKTARRSYDEIVVAVLLRAAYWVGNGDAIGSDGCWDDWSPGIQLYRETFPNDPVPDMPTIDGSPGAIRYSEEKRKEKQDKGEGKGEDEHRSETQEASIGEDQADKAEAKDKGKADGTPVAAPSDLTVGEIEQQE